MFLEGEIMINKNILNPELEIDYPNFNDLSEAVREKYNDLSTKVNLFRMLGHSPNSFVEMMDLTESIFKKLTISDYDKELLVLQTAAYNDNAYEWAQHIIIGETAGINNNQMLAIIEGRINDDETFSEKEQQLLLFGEFVLKTGKVPKPIFKKTLEYYTLEKLTDAMVVIGYYQMISIIIQTFDISIDQQEHGDWIKN
jgi:alkylhydroperoxidase family enzyme